jgi:hypothetical protein
VKSFLIFPEISLQIGFRLLISDLEKKKAGRLGKLTRYFLDLSSRPINRAKLFFICNPTCNWETGVFYAP